MPLFLQIYIFCVVFYIGVIINASIIITNIARELEINFIVGHRSSFIKLILIGICPVLNLLSGIFLLCIPSHVYKKIMIKSIRVVE